MAREDQVIAARSLATFEALFEGCRQLIEQAQGAGQIDPNADPQVLGQLVVAPNPDTRQRFLGFMEYAASFGTGADSIVDSALNVYGRDGHQAGVHLKPGGRVVTRAEGLGQTLITIVAGDRSETS